MTRYDRAMAGHEDAWSERYRLDMERVPRWVSKWFLDLLLKEEADTDRKYAS